MNLIRKVACFIKGHNWDYWGNVFVQERKCKRCASVKSLIEGDK